MAGGGVGAGRTILPAGDAGLGRSRPSGGKQTGFITSFRAELLVLWAERRPGMCVMKLLPRRFLQTSLELTFYPQEVIIENETQERVVETRNGLWVHRSWRTKGGRVLAPRPARPFSAFLAPHPADGLAAELAPVC